MIDPSKEEPMHRFRAGQRHRDEGAHVLLTHPLTQAPVGGSR
jgi:hypothetical protein